jgi:hypothetical protein
MMSEVLAVFMVSVATAMSVVSTSP